MHHGGKIDKALFNQALLFLYPGYIPLHALPLRLARRYEIANVPLSPRVSACSSVTGVRGELTRSVTFLFRSNSALAKPLVSARVLLSGMRRVARRMVR